MFRILNFKYLYTLPIIAIMVFYVFPSLLAVFFNGNPSAGNLLMISCISIATYFMAYYLLSGSWFKNLFKGIPKIPMHWKYFSYSILIVYFSIIIYACLTVSQVALFAALEGSNITDLSVLREEFLRTRTGWEHSLLYIYTICISALMPLIITTMFAIKARWRLTLLFLFIFSLILTLEKGRVMVALLPLIVLFVNQGQRQHAYKTIALLISTIVLVSVIARGGLASSVKVDSTAVTTTDTASSTPVQYNLFKGQTGQVYYLVNRVIYIPYITAIDWLRYKEEIRHGEAVSGQSIGIVAWLSGLEKINLEREVFAFQWGQNETKTGSSNTVFYIDAYLNFGMFGVILYSMLLAFFIRVCVLLGNEALIACLAISLYYVVFQGLSAVLFSGGLGFLFIIALFFKFQIDKNLAHDSIDQGEYV